MNAIKFKITLIFFVLPIFITLTAYAYLPGPDYIYKCPNCRSFIKTGSISSGNTIGLKLYSDGKYDAPMLPESPNLTKCQKCDTILWLSEMKTVGECREMMRWKRRCMKKWRKAEWAEFLDVTDLFRFLEIDKVKNSREKELYVRQRIWWTFNDGLRNNSELFVKENDKILWEQNCRRLIDLFDSTDVNQRFMIAELHRNLGEFDICMKIINSLDSDYDWLIEKYRIECEKQNRFLIQLR